MRYKFSGQFTSHGCSEEKNGRCEPLWALIVKKGEDINIAEAGGKIKRNLVGELGGEKEAEKGCQ